MTKFSKKFPNTPCIPKIGSNWSEKSILGVKKALGGHFRGSLRKVKIRPKNWQKRPFLTKNTIYLVIIPIFSLYGPPFNHFFRLLYVFLTFKFDSVFKINPSQSYSKSIQGMHIAAQVSNGSKFLYPYGESETSEASGVNWSTFYAHWYLICTRCLTVFAILNDFNVL